MPFLGRREKVSLTFAVPRDEPRVPAPAAAWAAAPGSLRLCSPAIKYLG